MSKHRGAKGFLIKSYTKKRSVGQRKVIRTTLGELIAAVTDEVKPIIRSPSRLYNWVVRNQIRGREQSRQNSQIIC
jgi:hypothetical protein